MKIVLITGMSGSGKTTIAKDICERYPDKYNFVYSYTDREMRNSNEWGHIFVESNYMDMLLEDIDIVAQTTIEKNRYCSLKHQFDKDKVNLYIVDINGINDTIKTFPRADIMTILIRRDKIEADCVRVNRDVNVPARDDVDFLIDNNGKIESSSNLLCTLVNFDLFSKPSHTVDTIEDKLKYIDNQYRYLDEIKASLYEQIWYRDYSLYKQLCKNVETKINNDFDFDIKVLPDSFPEIYDGELTFNIQATYDDGNLTWDNINRMVELLSKYSFEFCDDNDCKDMAYRIAVSEKWNGEDNYL